MQQSKKCVMFALAVGLCCFVVMGCDSGLKTEYVEGVVTLDGTPVEGATVIFSPVDDEVGMSASGTTDADGKYTLTATDPTAKVSGGTLPGEYKIMVTKAVSTEEFVGAEEGGDDEGNTYAEVEYDWLIPEKYSRGKTSGLTATVTAGGDNEFDFPLTSE